MQNEFLNILQMKRRHCAPLSEPQVKRRPGHDLRVTGSPLPVPVASLTGVPASNSLWAVYYGSLVTMEAGRHRVEVSEPGQARAIYNNGYFGDLVTRGRPEDKARPVLEAWSPSLDRDRVKAGDESSAEEPSCWSEVKATSSKADNQTEADSVLHLELCEAFFLSYSIGCLVVNVRDPGAVEEMSLIRQWRQYTKLEPDFPLSYRVYHHYRVRGWCVRSGHIMGADWVLYKLSPSHAHSTYTLRVEMVDRVTGAAVTGAGVRRVTWAELLGHTRVMGTVKKDLLIVRVSVSADLSDWDSPFCLNTMGVSAHRIRRWVPGDHRWKIKPKVPVLTLE